MTPKRPCDHKLRKQGDIIAYNPLDANGDTIWFHWCARCGALKVESAYHPKRWMRPRGRK